MVLAIIWEGNWEVFLYCSIRFRLWGRAFDLGIKILLGVCKFQKSAENWPFLSYTGYTIYFLVILHSVSVINLSVAYSCYLLCSAGHCLTKRNEDSEEYSALCNSAFLVHTIIQEVSTRDRDIYFLFICRQWNKKKKISMNLLNPSLFFDRVLEIRNLF